MIKEILERFFKGQVMDTGITSESLFDQAAQLYGLIKFGSVEAPDSDEIESVLMLVKECRLRLT